MPRTCLCQASWCQGFAHSTPWQVPICASMAKTRKAVELLTLKGKLKVHSQCCFPWPHHTLQGHIRECVILVGFMDRVAFGQGLEERCVWIGTEALRDNKSRAGGFREGTVASRFKGGMYIGKGSPGVDS